jgi:hypothetical protein
MGFSSFLLLLQANICLISKNLTFIVFRKFEAAEPKGPTPPDPFSKNAPPPHGKILKKGPGKCERGFSRFIRLKTDDFLNRAYLFILH